MIRLQEYFENGLNQLKLVNTLTGEQVNILPQFGANVNELVLAKNSRCYNLLDGTNSRDKLVGNAVYKGAKLVPCPNRVASGQYEFRGQNYQLACNEQALNNALHGFIYDKPFSVKDVDGSKNEATLTLVYKYAGDIAGYPFPMDIEIELTLSEKYGFYCSTKITNTGTNPMPIGDGWHPFLTFHKKVDDLQLKLPVQQKIAIDEQMIPTGKLHDYTEFTELQPIASTVFDTCFTVKDSDETYQSTLLHDPESNVTIKLWQETGLGKYNYLQVYIPPDRSSIAIEPMTCNVNAFNNGDGLIVLEANQQFEAAYGIRLV
ncbi:MAG: hypothetical protein DWQ10_14860 [Calditrichaeota bacterium]|nr:MAG: hypothetical protein DWQ10_14860 [Calditrichota bacterium]